MSCHPINNCFIIIVIIIKFEKKKRNPEAGMSTNKVYFNSRFLEMSSGVSHFALNFEQWFHKAI